MESNYMTQVAKMLGVELYEEFKTESTERGRFFYGSEVDVHVRFMFDELSLKRYNPDRKEWVEDDNMLVKLLYGYCKILKLENQKKTIVISAFYACGKTYACDLLTKEGYKVLDSDSSKFSWLSPKESQVIAYKNGDINTAKYTFRNSEFPQNYISHIKENIGKVDYIFVSSHKEVRDALIENNIPFSVVYPNKDFKAEWIGRCFLRGSKDAFCNTLAKNWDKLLDEIEKDAESDQFTPYELDVWMPYLYDLVKYYMPVGE